MGATRWLIFLPPCGGRSAASFEYLGSGKYARCPHGQVYPEPRFVVGTQTPVEHKVTPLLVKCLCRQLFEGLDYLQKNDIIHRCGFWNLVVLGP